MSNSNLFAYLTELCLGPPSKRLYVGLKSKLTFPNEFKYIYDELRDFITSKTENNSFVGLASKIPVEKAGSKTFRLKCIKCTHCCLFGCDTVIC